uniref:L-threonine 3-dehydrogenase, mitochondrial n=1 Tax=Haemonchus contortus TaxID=6289 RepID=A0A7I4YTG4_HAECO
MASISGKILRRSAALLNVNATRSYALPADPLARFKAIANASDERHRVLITGGLGQLGRGLNTVYKYMYGEDSVWMTDIVKAPTNASDINNYSYLDILNKDAIERLVVDRHIDTIVHYSALLSAVGEQNVNLALQINCRGVENVLEVARKHQLKVFIPSTIGAFGPTTPRDNVPDLTIQEPTTIYGVSKVYAERLGEYYYHKFGTDFRCLRFPGIISATKPGGGTTDYAIQIFYDALEKGKHVCYLRPDTMLPMMYDTDCMASVVQFLAAPSESLNRRTYNVTGFSFTPEEIANAIKKVMPQFKIEYEICKVRQGIADSWPRSLDDSGAKKDWGWHVEYGLDETVEVMFALLQREAQANANVSSGKTLNTNKGAS